MGGEKKSPLRMLSRFRTIRGAMIFSYMAITLLALLIFLLFSLNYTERTILENSESYTIQLVEQVNGDIDSYISYMENIMEIVTNNPELSDYLFDRMEHIMMRERIQEQFVTLLMPGLISATLLFLQRTGGRSSTEERTHAIRMWISPACPGIRIRWRRKERR